jgi:hypothetical protein
VLLIDAVFALVTEFGRRGTKRRLNPKRIELTRPAEPENRFEEYFGVPGPSANLFDPDEGHDSAVVSAPGSRWPLITGHFD